MLSRVLLLGAFSLVGCAAVPHPIEPHAAPLFERRAPAPRTWNEVFATPSGVEVRVEVAAHWIAQRRGLIDFRDPTTKRQGLRPGPQSISLLVGVIRHPEYGDFLVDTGIDASIAEGEPKAVRGVVERRLDTVLPVEDTASMRRRLELDLSGVLLTHTHFDHVLGLPDIPPDVPVYIGAGEQDRSGLLGALLRPGHARVYAGRAPLQALESDDGISLAPFDRVIDLLGDGSIWAIPTPGHTPGSMVYVVNAADGPVMFVGDTSHTWWGWNHGVPPGYFSEDRETTGEALDLLRIFAAAHPEVEVVVGHELARSR